ALLSGLYKRNLCPIARAFFRARHRFLKRVASCVRSERRGRERPGLRLRLPPGPPFRADQIGPRCRSPKEKPLRKTKSLQGRVRPVHQEIDEPGAAPKVQQRRWAHTVRRPRPPP